MLVDILINLSILSFQYQSCLFTQFLGHVTDNAVHLLEGPLKRYHSKSHNTVLKLTIYLMQLAGCLLKIIQLKPGNIRILSYHSLSNNQLTYQVHKLIQLIYPYGNHLRFSATTGRLLTSRLWSLSNFWTEHLWHWWLYRLAAFSCLNSHSHGTRPILAFSSTVQLLKIQFFHENSLIKLMLCLRIFHICGKPDAEAFISDNLSSIVIL